VYPAAHRALASRITGQGALLTEFPPGTPPRPQHFPLRNRLISGLAEALLVIEARERSGTLVTTGHAAAQGVDVFALPGPLGAAACAGSNRLLRDGAHIALEPEDVLGILRLGGLRLEPIARPAPRAAPAPKASAAGASILAALERAPAHRDELARQIALAPEALALELLELELAGRIREERDGRLRVVSPRATREL
jgi:DNA processing protein